MVRSIEVKGNTPMTLDRFDFHVIDSVYGRNSDLYLDVLRISPAASRKEIRAAFVNSRDEFFLFQSQVENGNVVVTDGQLDFSKRRMNAVVASFRILHDPSLRAFYDEARDKRLKKSKRDTHGVDSEDPVDQAVIMALQKKQGRASRPRPSSCTGMSPLQSSSGASTPESSDCEERNPHTPTKKRASPHKFFTSNTTAPRKTSTPNISDGENGRPRLPSKKSTSRRKTPFPSENPVSSDEEGKNYHSPTKNRNSLPTKSSRLTDSPIFVMKDETPTPTPTPTRRKKQVRARSLLESDSDTASIYSHDIGASRNYFKEKKNPGLDTVSTTATINEDVSRKVLYVNPYDDDNNSMLASKSTETTEYEPTEQTDDLSIQESVTPSLYMYDDDTTFADEEDLGELCCSPNHRQTSTRDLGFVNKTRRFILAIKSEIKGSINDTVTAVDQVCNAFTLQEKDIQAVTARIDKASKQLKR